MAIHKQRELAFTFVITSSKHFSAKFLYSVTEFEKNLGFVYFSNSNSGAIEGNSSRAQLKSKVSIKN